MEDQTTEGIIEWYVEVGSRDPIPKNYPAAMMLFALAEDHPLAASALSNVWKEQGEHDSAKLFRYLDDMNIRGQAIAYAYYNICAGLTAEFIEAVSTAEKSFIKALNDDAFPSRWWVVKNGAVKGRLTRAEGRALPVEGEKTPGATQKSAGATTEAQAKASARVGVTSGTRAAIMGASDRVKSLGKANKGTEQPKKYPTPKLTVEGGETVLRNKDGSEYKSERIGAKVERDDQGLIIRYLDEE